MRTTHKYFPHATNSSQILSAQTLASKSRVCAYARPCACHLGGRGSAWEGEAPAEPRTRMRAFFPKRSRPTTPPPLLGAGLQTRSPCRPQVSHRCWVQPFVKLAGQDQREQMLQL